MGSLDNIEIVVTDHALWRAAERRRCSVTVEGIEQDIREAYAAGRVSAYKVAAGYLFSYVKREDASYVWTEDSSRIYIVVANEHRLIVVTTYEREAA